jgi:hypothetical protein
MITITSPFLPPELNNEAGVSVITEQNLCQYT